MALRPKPGHFCARTTSEKPSGGGSSAVEGETEGEIPPMAFASDFSAQYGASGVKRVPGALMATRTPLAEMEMWQWLEHFKAKSAQPVFDRTQVDVATMLELTDDEFETWIVEMKFSVIEKMRLRKGLRETRAELLVESPHSDLRADAETERLKAGVELKEAESSTKLATVSGAVPKLKFDLATAKLKAKPELYEVSEDLLTATKKQSGLGHILLNRDSDIRSLQLCVGKRTRSIAVAVVDVWYDDAWNGCCFYDDGDVWVNGTEVAKSQSFGRSVGFQKDDVVTLTIDMEPFKVTIKSPYGSYEQKWQPRSTAFWVAVEMRGKDTSLSIVN